MDALTQHWQAALSAHRYDGAWITAGEALSYFQDDHGPPFKANPYLSQWIDPKYITPGSALWISPHSGAKLFTVRTEDYWHAVPELPDEAASHVEVNAFENPAQLAAACQAEQQGHENIAVIGENAEFAGANEQLGDLNPASLVNYLHFHRAKKSPFELDTMRRATEVGVRGHLAAAAAFHAQATEFEIHMAYLSASRQAEIELPYANIVALNEHAGVLHYQFQDREHPRAPLSLLIDAGGQFRGYASDITRTHVQEGTQHATFAGLISAMDTHQQALVEVIRPGYRFADLHTRMHEQLTALLVDCGIVRGGRAATELAMTERISETFCPHGLGHLLGLQVHDVGGHLGDARGTPAPPAANYPTLRFTRAVEEDYVFTVEPGLYFIPSLLKKLRRAGNATQLDWALIDTLAPYGGIRIEDNVRVTKDGVENFTREAFQHMAGS